MKCLVILTMLWIYCSKVMADTFEPQYIYEKYDQLQSAHIHQLEKSFNLGIWHGWRSLGQLYWQIAIEEANVQISDFAVHLCRNGNVLLGFEVLQWILRYNSPPSPVIFYNVGMSLLARHQNMFTAIEMLFIAAESEDAGTVAIKPHHPMAMAFEYQWKVFTALDTKQILAFYWQCVNESDALIRTQPNRVVLLHAHVGNLLSSRGEYSEAVTILNHCLSAQISKQLRGKIGVWLGFAHVSGHSHMGLSELRVAKDMLLPTSTGTAELVTALYATGRREEAVLQYARAYHIQISSVDMQLLFPRVLQLQQSRGMFTQ